MNYLTTIFSCDIFSQTISNTANCVPDRVCWGCSQYCFFTSI
ncbi:TPA: DUF3079 domain-containing protein [Acinetobacter baumannii]|nr:DUF3079 domain-containing protein [Acinetobacter baumannii]